MLNFMHAGFLSLLISLGGCASKKPTNNTEVPAENNLSQSLNKPLELKGDSDSGTAGDLATVYFPLDSYTLSETAKAVLKSNAEFLKANKSVDIQIEGHCDERGSIQYNLALGEKRAKSVREYLVALGISKQRISTISYGKERPVSFGHDEDSWSKNRRANFVITSK